MLLPLCLVSEQEFAEYQPTLVATAITTAEALGIMGPQKYHRLESGAVEVGHTDEDHLCCDCANPEDFVGKLAVYYFRLFEGP